MEGARCDSKQTINACGSVLLGGKLHDVREIVEFLVKRRSQKCDVTQKQQATGDWPESFDQALDWSRLSDETSQRTRS